MIIKKSQLKTVIKGVVREAIEEKKDKWIQKAVDPKHKGYCTPMTKKTCTPARKALAKRFKKGIENESQGGMSVQHDYEGDNSRMRKLDEIAAMFDEASPKGAKAERAIGHIKTSLRSTHPDWSEDKVAGVAIGAAWKMRNQGSLEEFGATSESAPGGWEDEKGGVQEGGPQYKVVSPTQLRVQKDNQGLEMQYDPKMTEATDKSANPLFDKIQTIIRVCEAVAGMIDENPELAKNKLLEMAENLKTGMGHVGEASYKKVSPNETDTEKEDKARKIQTEPDVTENHKVQARSYTTVNDAPQDPNNVRDPEVPSE